MNDDEGKTGRKDIVHQYINYIGLIIPIIFVNPTYLRGATNLEKRAENYLALVHLLSSRTDDVLGLLACANSIEFQDAFTFR